MIGKGAGRRPLRKASGGEFDRLRLATRVAALEGLLSFRLMRREGPGVGAAL